MQTNSSAKTRSLVEVALFAAIVFILAFTPFIGFIPIGPVRATTIHIPVIIAAIMLGPKKGAVIGFIFGIASFLNSSFFAPSPASFVFSPFYPGGNALSLIVCFVPRTLIGVTTYYVYAFFKSIFKEKTTPAIVIGALAGSMTNTILVMTFIYIFFGRAYAAVNEVAAEALFGVILGVIATNGVPEAIVASLIAAAVCRALMSFRKVQL